MAKTANIYARVDPVVKEKAEAILAELGVPMSVCVEMMLRALVREERLPFEVRVARKRPLSVGEMTEEELIAAVDEAILASDNGFVRDADAVEQSFAERFGS